MRCPKCAVELSTLAFDVEDRGVAGPRSATLRLELERCGDCDGVWFDADELRRYLDARPQLSPSRTAPAQSRRSRDEKSGDCPRCGKALERKPAPTNPRLTADACAGGCGVWLDGDELADAGGESLPFNERLKAMFGDLKPS